MVQIGVHNEGFLDYPLKKLDNGAVVPDVSLSEIHARNQQLVEKQIEIGVRAEALGYDYVLHPENHLMLLAKNSPTPLQVQVAIAAQTEEIRLLQMANILPWHEPITLAERLGMLDVISDGRLEVGVGKGSGKREIEVFGQYRREEPVSDETTWELFLEKCEILVGAWTQSTFSYRGAHHEIPPSGTRWENDHEHQYLADEVSGVTPDAVMDVTAEPPALESISVFPQPVQEPHPQLWRPIATQKAAAWAGRHGLNGCTFCTNFDGTHALIETYYEAAAAAGWPDRRPQYDGEPFAHGWDEQRRRGLVAEVPVFNTEVASDEAFERYKLSQEFQQSVRKFADSRDQEVVIDAETYLAENDAPIVGDTDTIVDQLATFREQCGYEDFLVFPTIGAPGMRHEDKLTQLEAFAERVAPYFEEEATG